MRHDVLCVACSFSVTRGRHAETRDVERTYPCKWPHVVRHAEQLGRCLVHCARAPAE